MTTDDFINKARKVHGDKYDYSEVVYVNAKTTVRIICPVHGVFMQFPDNHLKGHGCRKCAFAESSERKLKWTRERCFEEARKYRTKTEFSKGNRKCFERCVSMGYLAEMDWLEETRKPRGYWTKERVFEEAKDCHTRVEFFRLSQSAYDSAWKNGWLDEMTWLDSGRKPDGYWTKERVFEESKAFETKGEFKTACSHLYQKARENGWLDEMTWLVPSPKYWTKESIFAEARKYKTRNEFGNDNNYAYRLAFRNGWLDEMEWLEYDRKPVGYWNRERVFEESKKYDSRTSFAVGSPTAYNSARENGWLDDMDWLVAQRLPEGFWTREKVFEEARKYSSRSEFSLKSTAYRVARANDWLDEMDWLRTPVLGDLKEIRCHVVYAYVDEERLAVYVGRTLNLHQRHLQHKSKRINDTVYKYFSSRGMEIPEPILLAEDLLPEESQAEEKNFTELFYEKGYMLLNNRRFVGIGKSSLGGGYRKWTKERVFEESKKYSNRNKFRLGSPGAYSVALDNCWLDEMPWLESVNHPIGFWDIKENVIEESKKYKSRTEFRKKASVAYSSASRNGWLDEMTWFVRPVPEHYLYWTREKVFEESHKYDNRPDFRNGSNRAYNVARKNGWLEEMTWLLPKSRSLSKESVFSESRKYTSRGEFAKGSKNAYNTAWRNGWLEEMTWLVRQNHGTWTKDQVLEESKKYSSRKQFKLGNPGAYGAARNHGWIEEMVWLNKRNTK